MLAEQLTATEAHRTADATAATMAGAFNARAADLAPRAGEDLAALRAKAAAFHSRAQASRVDYAQAVALAEQAFDLSRPLLHRAEAARDLALSKADEAIAAGDPEAAAAWHTEAQEAHALAQAVAALQAGTVAALQTMQAAFRALIAAGEQLAAALAGAAAGAEAAQVRDSIGQMLAAIGEGAGNALVVLAAAVAAALLLPRIFRRR